MDATAGPDTTPTTVAWRVNTAGPAISLLVTPPAVSSVPASSASFVLQSSSVFDTTFVYRVLQSGSADSDSADSWVPFRVGTGNASFGNVTSRRGAATISPLTSGTRYRLDAWGVDAMGNTGTVASWTWIAAPCPIASNVSGTTVAALQGSSVDVGERVFLWTAPPAAALLGGVEYAVDGGSWTSVRYPAATANGQQVRATCDACEGNKHPCKDR